MSDDELDNLFKEAVDGFKPPNDPSAWADMSTKLDQAAVVATSFWNWKTISTTVLVGVATVALVLYVLLPVSTSVSESNPKSMESSGPAVTQPNEKAAVDIRSADSKPETNRATQILKKENNQAAEVSRQRKNDKPAVDNSKTSNEAGVVPDKTTQSTILSEQQINSSQESPNVRQSTKANNREAETTNTISSRSRDNGNAKDQLVTVVPGGVAVTEKVIDPTSSGNVVAGESGLNKAEPNSMTKSSSAPVSVTADPEKVRDGAGVETISNGVVTEKVLEPNSTGNVAVSESNSNQVSVNAKGSKDQSVLVADDSVKKHVDQNEVEKLSDKISDQSEPERQEEKSSFNRFAFKLAVAPDYSTVKSATPNSLGINYGVLFEYRISNHWSVATGGIWSKKIYSAYDVEYSGYHADWVDGDCRMWDIPVNVYYNFSSSKAFSFYVSVGFSSYLMNEENYVYYVETSHGTYDYPKQVKRENNEWFKTLNISAGMQFRMNKQFSLQFEPTLKAPLAGVGEGEVSLVSLGAFFNLRYEIPFKQTQTK